MTWHDKIKSLLTQNGVVTATKEFGEVLIEAKPTVLYALEACHIEGCYSIRQTFTKEDDAITAFEKYLVKYPNEYVRIRKVIGDVE
jgi:hypothetical protein